MTFARGVYWLVFWLLSPTDRMPLVKSIFTGVILRLVSLLIIPLVPALQAAGVNLGTASATPDYLTHDSIVYGVLVGPVKDAVGMALIFGASGWLGRLTPAVPVAFIVVSEVLLNDSDLAGTLFVAFNVTALSLQYVLCRDRLRTPSAILCVALTQSALNLSGVVLTLALGR